VSKIDTDFLDKHLVKVLLRKLVSLENRKKNKLSKGLAFSIFILTIIWEKTKGVGGWEQREYQVLREDFLDQVVPSSELASYVADFRSDSSNPTYFELMQWFRNRVTHFADISDHGLTVEERVHGIRGFEIVGTTSRARSARCFSGKSNRAMLTAFVKKIAEEYIKTANRIEERKTISKNQRDEAIAMDAD
jgi:hypothetical protein